MNRIYTAVIIVTMSLLHYSCNKIDYSNPSKEIVLRLTPKTDNPRNSEGDFIQLNIAALDVYAIIVL